MKQCSRCGETKEYQFFAKRSKARDGYAVWCKECFKAYDRERYKTVDKERKTRNRNLQMERKRELLWNILSQSQCAHCGNNDPEVLEFDHRQPSDKMHNISEIMWSHSWDSIKKEIDKCDILCANCHRKRTIKQFGFWRGLQSNG